MVGLSSRASEANGIASNHQSSFFIPQALTSYHYHTVTWRCFSQAVVFLYLLDEKTSLLVLVPAGIAAVIEVRYSVSLIVVAFY